MSAFDQKAQAQAKQNTAQCGGVDIPGTGNVIGVHRHRDDPDCLKTQGTHRDEPWDGLHLHEDKYTEEEKEKVKAFTTDEVDEYVSKPARTQRGTQPNRRQPKL